MVTVRMQKSDLFNFRKFEQFKTMWGNKWKYKINAKYAEKMKISILLVRWFADLTGAASDKLNPGQPCRVYHLIEKNG